MTLRYLRAAAMDRALRLKHKPGFEAAAREARIYTTALWRAGERSDDLLVLRPEWRVE